MTKYIEDPGYLEQILKKLCPYCESALQKPYKTKRECSTCDFTLYGNPKLLAFKIEEQVFEYTYKIDKCPECESTNLFYEKREKELVCKACGLVLSGQTLYSSYTRIKYPFGTHTNSYNLL